VIGEWGFLCLGALKKRGKETKGGASEKKGSIVPPNHFGNL